ncbi:TonB-dependent receptor [uncultured Sphingomonas sp.]|uniref:TonB-dependent receptor n=1 Tax=uncultured Sphingomonas sp. TaxID=158754 RepID=UPI0035CBF10D
MTVKTQLRATTSAVALFLGAAPAFAQTPPSGPATQPPATQSPATQSPATQPPATETPDTAQGTPADATDPVGDETAGEDVVVTGIRASLASSQSLKRNAPQIVDAVVAEDIGKLPDIAVSDTAARIPGVQVVRLGGEAAQVLIRGLPEAFFGTLYNGREIFTAERREVALQDFPSAGIAALEVFKASTANLVEPGVAGLTNVRSRRPFDFTGFELSGTVYGLHTVQAGKVTPNGNMLISNRWETGIGEIGLLVNGSYTELQFLDSEPSNTDFVADPTINGQRVRFPDIQRLFYRSGNRSRPSGNASLQWRPSPDLEFYAEGLYQGFRNRIDDRTIEVPLFGNAESRTSYGNLVLRPGANLLESGTVTNSAGALFAIQGGTFNKTDTYQFAVGGIYDVGPLRITADLARTKSSFTGSTESVDRTLAGGQTVDFDLRTPQFGIPSFNAADTANYFFDGLYEEAQEAKGDDYQARIDAEYKLDGGFIRSLQVGARYTTRDARREFGNRFAGFRGQNIPQSALPLDIRSVRSGFKGTDVQDFRTFLAPTYDSIRANRVDLRRFVRARGAANFTDEAVEPNPFETFDATLETITGYGQVGYAVGEVLDGTVGIRVVRSDLGIDGTSLVDPTGEGAATATPVSLDDRFTDYLPNANIRWRITPELQLRLSATQTRTLPSFAQLNPSQNLGRPGNQTPSASNPYINARVGRGGNPDLQRAESNSYDASLEYFFSNAGFASVAVFRRDVDNFIQTLTNRFNDPILGPIVIENRPINTQNARIDGVEAQLSTFFDFDFLPDFARSFGVQLNYTYLDAKTDFPVQREDGTTAVIRDRIQEVSKHTYNIVGLFERGPVSGRLTYNKRSRYLDRRDVRFEEEGLLYREIAKPAGRLDLSTNLRVNDNATIFFDATNLTGKPFRVDFSSARQISPGGVTPVVYDTRAEFVRFLRFDEQTFSLGLRFRI